MWLCEQIFLNSNRSQSQERQFFGNRNEKIWAKSHCYKMYLQDRYLMEIMCPVATKVFHASRLFCKWVNKADVNLLVIATRLVTGLLYCFAVNTSYSSLYHMILNWVQNVQYLHKNKKHMLWHVIVNLPFFAFTEWTEMVTVKTFDFFSPSSSFVIFKLLYFR